MRTQGPFGMVTIGLSIVLLAPAFAISGEREELQRSLEAAELSFAASLAEKDLVRFASHIDEKAIFAAGPVREGKSAILESWSHYFEPDAPTMKWHPETVVVQDGGRLGISKGPYTWTGHNDDGSTITRSGQFISIWEYQENGTWRVIFDSGCPPCPECPPQ